MSLDRIFRLNENGTCARTETLAGLTTFLTMAYIIFVQPAVLSGAMFGFSTGMEFGALTTATCVSAAVACFVMGLYGRYPIALAPGMGENFFFVFSVIPAAAAAGFQAPWRVALGVVFVSGLLFYALYAVGVRERVLDAISPSLKNGVAAGIGLFIAFIGLQNSGLIVTAASVTPGNPPLLQPGTLVKLTPQLQSPDLLVFAIGLTVMAALQARGVRGSILWGIMAAAGLAVALRLILPHVAPDLWSAPALQQSRLATLLRLPDLSLPPWQWAISLPPSPAPTFMQMDIRHALAPAMIPFILIFLFMDVFDTIGTLVGVGEQAGFMRDNKMPRARQAMLADQTGTLVGAVMGTSTVTSYIESAAGVAAGGRTGLTSVIVGLLFLVALFFSPLIALIGSYPPVTAPALVFVGAMMLRNVARIAWDDMSEAIPAFLIVMGIPLCYSISDGLALGFIAYPAVKWLGGRGRECGWLMNVLAVVLVLYLVFLRAAPP